MAYSWSKTFNAGMRGVSLNEQPTADVVGKVLDGIEKKQGEITPEAFVAASTRPAAKTHGMFEWDDTVASSRYRLEQAGDLVVEPGPGSGKRPLEEETRRVLEELDKLLEHVPEDLVEEFTRSAAYFVYEKVMNYYGIS